MNYNLFFKDRPSMCSLQKLCDLETFTKLIFQLDFRKYVMKKSLTLESISGGFQIDIQLVPESLSLIFLCEHAGLA